MEYYSATKKNELLVHGTTWANLKIMMLSERSQTKRVYSIGFYLCKILENATL